MDEAKHQSFMHSIWSSRLISTKCVLWCSLFLQTVGCAAPGWVFLRFFNGDVIHIGLWWVTKCRHKCRSESTEEYGGYLTYGEDELNWYRVATILGILTCFVSVNVFRFGLSSEKTTSRRRRYILGCTVVTCIFSGLSANFAVANIGWNNIKLVDAFGDHNAVSFPYALFLSGLGGLVAFVTGLFISIRICYELMQKVSHYDTLTDISPDLPKDAEDVHTSTRTDIVSTCVTEISKDSTII